MNYILLLVFTIYKPIPANITLSEFQTKESCELALDIAKSFYKTVNDESKCINVKNEIEKRKLREQLNKLGDE
jgi:hypothetical protein